MFKRIKETLKSLFSRTPKEPELLIFSAGTDSYRARTKSDIPALLQGPYLDADERSTLLGVTGRIENHVEVQMFDTHTS